MPPRTAATFVLLAVATALSCQRVKHRTRGGLVMAGQTDDQSLLEEAPRERAGVAAAAASANVMQWEASATATEPCGPGMPAFLAEAASTDLVLRMDESVVGCQGESPAAPCGARAC